MTRRASTLGMDTSETDFDALLEKARTGDGEAFNELARTYEADLRIAARVHLGPALRPYLDSLDLVQSVHRSLIRGLRDERLKPGDANSLLALALTMVRRKVAKQWRRHRRQLRVDSRLDTSETTPQLLANLTGRSLDPGRSAASAEAISQVINRLDATDRQLIELRLQGWNNLEVAAHTGQSPAALRIRFHRLRLRLADARIASDWL